VRSKHPHLRDSNLISTRILIRQVPIALWLGSSKLINKRPVIIDSDEDDEAADESIIIVEKKPAKKIKIGSESGPSSTSLSRY
jgi:hypothetical protein